MCARARSRAPVIDTRTIQINSLDMRQGVIVVVFYLNGLFTARCNENLRRILAVTIVSRTGVCTKEQLSRLRAYE